MELDISQVAYSKLEKNETKSTVKRLFKLAAIFEVDVGQLLGIKANSQDIFINPEDSTGSYYYNAEIYRENGLQQK